MAIISLIACMSQNRVIGQDGAMPWHMPADLKHFKALTLGKPIIMGRKTYESIGKPLPQRQNIIVTRNSAYAAAGVTVVHSLAAALEVCAQAEEIMIIGGAQLYRQALARADKMYLTELDFSCEGDAYFPEWSAQEWELLAQQQHSADDKNLYHYTFKELKRI